MEPQFSTRHRGIATPQFAWFQNPALSYRKSPGLLQLPLGWQASRLASSKMLIASYLSLSPSAPKLDGLAWHSGGHLSFASATIKRVASLRPVRAPRDQGTRTIRAAETASRDAFCGRGWRLLQLCIIAGLLRSSNLRPQLQLPSTASPIGTVSLSIEPKERAVRTCQKSSAELLPQIFKRMGDKQCRLHDLHQPLGQRTLSPGNVHAAMTFVCEGTQWPSCGDSVASWTGRPRSSALCRQVEAIEATKSTSPAYPGLKTYQLELNPLAWHCSPTGYRYESSQTTWLSVQMRKVTIMARHDG